MISPKAALSSPPSLLTTLEPKCDTIEAKAEVEGSTACLARMSRSMIGNESRRRSETVDLPVCRHVGLDKYGGKHKEMKGPDAIPPDKPTTSMIYLEPGLCDQAGQWV